MSYIGNTPGVSSQRVMLEEVVSGSPKSTFTPISGYTLGYVDVLVNGVEVDTADFTASDGVNVTLATAAAVGDTVKIKTWLPRGLSDGYLKSEADAKFVDVTGDTMTGLLTLPNLTFSGTGARITGDFSNSTVANRVMFQTSTANTFTMLNAMPSGTGTFSGMQFYGGSDTANTTVGQIGVSSAAGGAFALVSDKTGTGTYMPMTFYTGGSERMRVDTSGNVAIGGNAAAEKLHVYGSIRIEGTSQIQLYNSGYFIRALTGLEVQSADFIRFLTSGANERMRIDSSGNFLVGTTDISKTAGVGLKLNPNAGGTNSAQFSCVGAASTNSNESYHLYSTGAGAYRFYVGYGGTVYATSTSISAISDIRFKENVRDLDVGLAEVMALKPRLYDWKEGKGADIKNARGFIAQEFETVFPDLIDEWKDEAPEGEEPYKSVRQDLIPVLVKAIQEQQAIIEQLRADVETLKGQA